MTKIVVVIILISSLMGCKGQDDQLAQKGARRFLGDIDKLILTNEPARFIDEELSYSSRKWIDLNALQLSGDVKDWLVQMELFPDDNWIVIATKGGSFARSLGKEEFNAGKLPPSLDQLYVAANKIDNWIFIRRK